MKMVKLNAEVGKNLKRNLSSAPAAAELKKKLTDMKDQSLPSQGKGKKVSTRKFGERKEASQMAASSNDKSSTKNSDDLRKNGAFSSRGSSSTNRFKEKLPSKRKNLDEVDSFCSPAKLLKASCALTDVKKGKSNQRNGNKDCSSAGKRKLNSKEKADFNILPDEVMTSNQLTSCTKNKDNSISKSDAAKDKHCTQSNSSKRNKKVSLTPKQSKDSTTKKTHIEKKQFEKQSPDARKKAPLRKKRIEKQSTKLSKKSNSTNTMSAKVDAGKSVSLISHVDAVPSTSNSMNSDITDPLALLMMMEGSASSQKDQKTSTVLEVSTSDDSISGIKDNQDLSTDSEEEMSDWEDVHDHPLPDTSKKSQLPDKPVVITMDLPDILKKKKKKKAFDWKAYFEQRMRRFKKEVAANMHKTHLLCLIAHGIRQNTVLNEPILSALLLSIVPRKFDLTAGTSEEKQVDSLMSWYRKMFPLNQVTFASQISLISAGSMMRAVSMKSITDARMWVFVFICLLRALHFKVRLVLSFQPMPFKPDQVTNLKTPSGKGKLPAKGEGKPKGKAKKDQVSKSNKSKQSPKPSKPLSSALPSSSSSKSKYFKSPSKISSSSTPHSCSSSSSRTQSARKSKEQAKLKSRQNLKDEENDVFTDGDDDDEMSDTEQKKTKKKKPVKKIEKEKDNHDSESEFEESPSLCLKKDLKIKSNRKILSVSSEDEFDCSQSPPKISKAHDFWMELYVKDKKKWICFDCFKVQFGKPYSLEQSATQPLSYVVGFRNDNCVKDVTSRYAKQWLSQTRKLRVDADWVNDTFSYFDFSSYEERIMEEDDIKSQLMVRPMPTSIGDFKNHPLYALKRHLLKFEAIYPNTAIPLGYIRNEPIYARECVRLLHSRDNWLKEGRFVRLKEEPYKMVKSRPKWNKPKDNPDELDLEIFGEWQTEKYIPPPAVNGKVPKNDYGNVELFQPWMLPKGTVHLKVQGLQRVAKKLGIDVAPAMIGWDYHSGYSHPVMDGWVVCEEFADALLEAWDEDQENQRQREEEKRDKRVYGNWKRLIRGLLIKERLKNKFLEEKTLAVTSKTLKEAEDELHFSDAEPALPAEQFWPQNRQEEEKAEMKEKMQKYKSELKKEREKRKEETVKDADGLKEEPSDILKVQRSAIEKNAKSLNKSNTRNKRVSRSIVAKRKFNTVESSESSSEEEGEKIVCKPLSKKKEENELNSKQRAAKKSAKKKMSDDEEEDETYIPTLGSRKRHEQDTEISDEEDCTQQIGRQTRSRRRRV